MGTGPDGLWQVDIGQDHRVKAAGLETKRLLVQEEVRFGAVLLARGRKILRPERHMRCPSCKWIPATMS